MRGSDTGAQLAGSRLGCLESIFRQEQPGNRCECAQSGVIGRSRVGVESGGVPWALLGWRFSIYNFPTKNRLPCTPLIVGCSVLDAPEPASLLPKIFC